MCQRPAARLHLLNAVHTISELMCFADPLLALVNEPPPGRLTNVHDVDGKDAMELVFVVTAAVRSGEELFVDYGTTFDRSDYS